MEILNSYLKQMLDGMIQKQSAVRPDQRPQGIRFDLSRVKMEQIIATDMRYAQTHWGKPRLTLTHYSEHRKIAQLSLVVYTNGALDVANMLNGEWLESRQNTLTFGQLTRVLDTSVWVADAVSGTIDGLFGEPTVVEGSVFDTLPLSQESPETLEVMTIPFEIPRLCAGLMAVCLHPRPVDLPHWTAKDVVEQYSSILIR